MNPQSNLKTKAGSLEQERAVADACAPEALEETPEVSVVIPCLNEVDTLGYCIGVAQDTMAANDIEGEVVVADNGSTDGSVELARKMGASVVQVPEQGYGRALMGGIAAARGRYVVMGDADASYDFSEIPNFVDQLRKGFALVQGCRLSSGGGTVRPGAMPFLHRWIGNPLFSMLARRFFKAPIHDINCGLRAFTKELYAKIDQRCGGMEFAVEMVLKASLYGEKIAEVPITLHPDRRINRAPHLKTFRDGWRTLRFFLLSSPRWLFLYPGIFFILLGGVGYAIALPATVVAGVGFDVNTLLLATLSVLLGYQAILFSVSAKTFAITEGLLPEDPRFTRWFTLFTLERGLIAGSISAVVGAVLILLTFNEWRLVDFGALNYQESLRLALPGVMFLTLGVQTIFASFFMSILGMRRN